jgi:hypothetical protein
MGQGFWIYFLRVSVERMSMRRVLGECLILFALASMGCSTLRAQQIVHALTGLVTAVHPAVNSITIQTNDGNEDVFKYDKKLRTSIEFDKTVRAETTEPSVYSKVGDRVVVYFFGDYPERTVVALKDLGKTPLDVSSGTVVKTQNHNLIIRNQAGVNETYEIAKDATVETSNGVVCGLKFHPEKGSQVTVRYETAGGNKVAQFVRAD